VGAGVSGRSVRSLIAILLVTPAWSHTGEPLQLHDFVVWSFDPLIVAGLGLAAWAYAKGLRRTKGIRHWEIVCYWIGWIALAAALISPLHTMGEALFSAHMAQHELLMVVAAPLLVLGRPTAPYLWSLPDDLRLGAMRRVRSIMVGHVLKTISSPLNAWAIHFAVLWIWHIPILFDLSVQNAFVHALQHISFLASAILFWWSLFGRPRRSMHYGAGAFYVFTTMVHTGVLGALLTFTTMPWYRVYRETTEAFGLSPLEDQQLGGLIMTVPPLAIYLVVFLGLFALWISSSNHSPILNEAQNAKAHHAD
jgi:putative membrane protein